jgi:NADPH-dependent glutamate synthase beta subunit-like oxidoreductase/Pyruvate/2-oxoacid:ferredoxin oxidoreductase delta subunit
MSRGALVIGASAAGLQATLDLADSGIHVHLVEPSPFLAGDRSAGQPPHLINTRLLEVSKHPNVTSWTNARVYRVEGEAGDWIVELRQHPRYIDLTKCTACGDCVKVCPVQVPGTDHRAIHLALGGQPGCAAIEKLGKPPCSNTCPGGIHVQGYIALTAEGRFREALDLIREAIPFPGICGRICTHPCEINCRRGEVDKPVAIRLLKRFLSDWELEQPVGNEAVFPENATEGRGELPPAQPGQTAAQTGHRIAIVGAGPGGMATAERLARMGYGVTVFEKLPVIGGMMAVGIPEYRLPRQVIAREYQHIQELGVELRLNTAIGPTGDHSLDDLFALGYSAVCLAVGAHRSHSLRIPGEELEGAVQGIDLLRTISLSQRLEDRESQAKLGRWLRGPGTRAAVLGGGNTAMDVARSLRRLGLSDVRILYRRTRAEMPAMPEEVEDAEREGVQIEFLISPVRVLGSAEAGVSGLECLRMKLGEPDASGRRRPVPIAGSEFVIDLDLVVLAIGQAPDLEGLGPDHGLAITRDERINVDGVSFMTSRPGVFACGDAVTADKMAVIEAIGFGKKAAAGIDAYLRGLEPHEQVTDARQVPIARRDMAPEELTPKPRVQVPLLSLDERLASYAEVERGYTEEQALIEASRCLVCGPCSECLACEHACKPGAVVHDQEEKLARLEIGAMVYAMATPPSADWALPEKVSLLHVAPDDLLGASATAAEAMFDLFAERLLPVGTVPARSEGAAAKEEGERPLAAAARVGVFVCECGGSISDVVDTDAVRSQAAELGGVKWAEILPFSCSPEAAEAIRGAAQTHSLNQVVLAACSCCAIDQICYSCTYQRVRCKNNLGVFPEKAEVAHSAGGDGGRARSEVPTALPAPRYEFVNIREQCAWVHAGDREAATAKAADLIAAAVARARLSAARQLEAQPPERSVLVLGSGAAGRFAVEALLRQGIAARHLRGVPAQVRRAQRRYEVSHTGAAWEGTALILAPSAGEVAPLLAAFGQDGHRPRSRAAWAGPDTHRPGVLFCDPALDPRQTAAAATARAAAWLGRGSWRADVTCGAVDVARCRACGTCVEICEFGAPQIVGLEPQRASWIDPAICTGCGTCAAHCPSGAIAAGYATDRQIEAMLEAALT